MKIYSIKSNLHYNVVLKKGDQELFLVMNLLGLHDKTHTDIYILSFVIGRITLTQSIS